MMPELTRTTEFVMDSVTAPPDTPVLFVKLAGDLGEGMVSLAHIGDIERLKKQVREAALDEVQEFVVRHCFDSTSGRRIDDFITGLLAAMK